MDEALADDTPSADRPLHAFVRELAVQDVLAPCFHGYFLLRGVLAPPGPLREASLTWAVTLFTWTVLTLILVRGRILPEGRLRSVVYRLGIFTPMVLSYFEMISLLPGLQPRLLDTQLHAIDLALFGETPSVVLARFNTRPIVEWIAFFYYSYFYLMALMLIPALFIDRGRRLAELMAGAIVVCGCGHVIYTLVPGVGPFRTLTFDAPLDGGFWWGQVQKTVSNAGAQLDIFPSLHTAYPTYFSLHAFGHRKTMPFRIVWPVIAFFTVNMVTATMFLRWHWGIDVVAGLTLAASARLFAIHVARREAERGTDGDTRMPVWEPLSFR